MLTYRSFNLHFYSDPGEKAAHSCGQGQSAIAADSLLLVTPVQLIIDVSDLR